MPDVSCEWVCACVYIVDIMCQYFCYEYVILQESNVASYLAVQEKNQVGLVDHVM